MSARGLHPLATQQCHCSIACCPDWSRVRYYFRPMRTALFLSSNTCCYLKQGIPLQSPLFRAWKSRLKGRRPIPIFYSKEKSSRASSSTAFVVVQAVIVSTMSSLYHVHTYTGNKGKHAHVTILFNYCHAKEIIYILLFRFNKSKYIIFICI